ncbi:unnamed protein product [Alopecurus aequalis]
MANPSTVYAAVALVVLLSTFPGLHTTHADAGFIARTCKKTKNPAQCVAVLSAYKESTKASTKHDLASIALQIAYDTAQHNREVIGDLTNKIQLGTPEGDALAACLGAYSDAVADLYFDGRPGFDNGDYGGTWKLLSGTKDTGDRCEKEFKGIGKKSPVTDIDLQMTERCGVASDLVALLIPK